MEPHQRTKQSTLEGIAAINPQVAAVLEELTNPAFQESYLHGVNVEGLSSGNVYRNGGLGSERVAFGVDQARANDLPEVQRALAPLD